jgi:hypothetical protein
MQPNDRQAILAEIAELERLREFCSPNDTWEQMIDARLEWLREKLRNLET